MATRVAPEEPPRTALRMGSSGVILVALLVYAIVVGGTSSGELDPVLRLINAVACGAMIMVLLVRGPIRADALDKALLVALLLFAAAGVGSSLPRQTLDAVLAAMSYLAMLFVAREQLGNPAIQRAMTLTMRVLAAVFAGGAATIWLVRIIDWWNLTGRAALPPLDLQLSAGPWGHRYDLAFLVVLLYPAWWVGGRTRSQMAGAVFVGVLSLIVVIVTGSRTAWLAVVGATVVVGIPVAYRAWSRSRRNRLMLAAGLAAIMIVGAAALLATPLGARLSNLESLDWRFAMWAPLTELWLQHPIAGIGPGGFPWALQMTDYYQTRTWAPRHPDSALMQVLPEAGLLGAAAMLITLVAVMRAVLSSRSRAAQWAVIAFAIACIGGNPSDFAYLIVVGIAWIAYAVPHATQDPGYVSARRHGGVLVATGAAAAIIAVAFISTVGAAFAYEGGRQAVADRDFTAARDAFRLAATADPGMALYHRQLGVAELTLGQPDAAVHRLGFATALNPSDDLAWRSVAVAYERVGRMSDSRAALDSALRVQRSDPSNLLLAARHARLAGDMDAAVALLGEAIQSWPAIVSAPAGEEVVGSTDHLHDGVDAAAERWLAGASTPEQSLDQGVWLGVMSGRDDVVSSGIDRSPLASELAAVLALQLRCDPAAHAALEALGSAHVRSGAYWELRARDAGLEGELDRRSLAVIDIMSGHGVTPSTSDTTANPFNENTVLSLDRWGYRRNPIAWPTSDLALPHVEAGRATWLTRPREAVDTAGLNSQLPEC